ncbi:peroxidase family protein [Bradyrhizobium japonicum]
MEQALGEHSTGRVNHGAQIPQHRRLQQQSCGSHLEPGRHRLCAAGPANFVDGVNEMTPGPNPREISNIVVAQTDIGEEGPHLVDDAGVALSGMMYAWGQFIDHDLDLQKEGTGTDDISIKVPADDEFCRPAA